MSELALKRIEENKELFKIHPEKAKFLDLGNCGLEELPKELFECIWIEELNLGTDYFKDFLSPSIESINESGLNTFELTQLSDLKFLQGLKKLYVVSCKIKTFEFLKYSSTIQVLDIRNNLIYSISEPKYLRNLRALIISGNPLKEIDSISKLENLEVFFLTNTADDNTRKTLRNIDFLSKLVNLRILCLWQNGIKNISNLINLINLEVLFLDGNQIKDISVLKKLTKLKILGLRNNKIDSVTPLRNLLSLNSLNISSNFISDIKDLYPLFKNKLEISKSFDSLFNNENKICLDVDLIKNPPPEIVKQGREALIKYFEKLEKEGKDYIYEAKVTLVGEGGAGKTSLQTRINDKDQMLPTSEDRTRGIKVTEWSFTDNQSNIFHVNIWDFGGQDVYFPVHRFFLTDNSVYILVATTRIQFHNFEYWIPTIYQFGGSSPIILVQTCHDGNKAHWNELSIFYSNPNFKLVKPHYELNLPNKNEGLERLEKAIEHQIVTLPHIGEAVPSSWKIVREKLSEEKKIANCISYERFVNLCKEVDKENFSTDKDIELIGRFFADLGIILWYYNKEYLKDWVILHPQWAMNAVYKIIDDRSVIESGIIHKSDFEKIWNDLEYVKRKDLLKKMLQEFKIAFPKKDNVDDYLLPIRLKSLPKDKQWTNFDKNTRLQYEFDFMPRGIVNQISAELSRYIISDSDVWNNAVNLTYTGSKAQIEEDFFNRKINIKAIGQEARSLVVLIMDAMDNTLQGYKGVKIKIQVPCSCEVCKKNPEPTLFPYSKLLEWMSKDQNVRCNESGKDIPIRSLLYDVGFDSIKVSKHNFMVNYSSNAASKTSDFVLEENNKISEIFFSYAWDKEGEEKSREQIVKDLYESLAADGFKVVLDKEDLKYKESIVNFMDRIGQGDIIVVAISDAYLKSINCMYEFYEIFKNSKLNKENMRQRIFPIRVETISLNKPGVLETYFDFWEDLEAEWKKLISKKATRIGASQQAKYRKIQAIASELGDFLDFLSDINSKSKEELSKDNFKEIKAAIKKQLEE